MGQSNLTTKQKEEIVSNYLNEIYRKEDCKIKTEKNKNNRIKWDKILFSDKDNLKIHIEEKSASYNHDCFPFEFIQHLIDFSNQINMKTAVGWICHCKADLVIYTYFDYDNNKSFKIYTMKWNETKEYILKEIEKNNNKYDIKITNKYYGTTVFLQVPWKELIENNVVKEGIYLDDIDWHSIEENDFDHKCPVKKGKFGSSYEYFDECEDCYKNTICRKEGRGY